jgi:hypothetical protein
VVFDPVVPVSLSAQLLVLHLLDKNPATRISLADVKVRPVPLVIQAAGRLRLVTAPLLSRASMAIVCMCGGALHDGGGRGCQRHPWILHGLEDPERWLDETDPAKTDRIEVSAEDESQAFSFFVRRTVPFPRATRASLMV